MCPPKAPKVNNPAAAPAPAAQGADSLILGGSGLDPTDLAARQGIIGRSLLRLGRGAPVGGTGGAPGLPSPASTAGGAGLGIGPSSSGGFSSGGGVGATGGSSGSGAGSGDSLRLGSASLRTPSVSE